MKKPMTRREITLLIDARRNLPGYNGTAPAWTVKNMARWMEKQLSRHITEAQARGFAEDAGISLIMKTKHRHTVDSGAKFIGLCLTDLYAAMGDPVPEHLFKWLQHKLTLDEAARMRGELLSGDERQDEDDQPGEQTTWQM